MTLPDKIRDLRDRALGELDAAHDYYSDSKTAWDLANRAIAAGQTFKVTNSLTGTVVGAADLADKSRGYIAKQLTEATFQQFVSLFESFVFDFLRLWLTAYPQSLGGKKVDFKAVLEAVDKDAITEMIVIREVNEVLYDRPSGWFAYLEAKANLGCPSEVEIGRIAEAKAARDVLVHARGIVSPAYLAKAGARARYEVGDRVEVTEPYHRAVWELFRKVVADVSDSATVKLSSPDGPA